MELNGSLFITKVKAEHAGKFRVTVYNPLGRVTEEMEVFVNLDPDDIIPWHTQMLGTIGKLKKRIV